MPAAARNMVRDTGKNVTPNVKSDEKLTAFVELQRQLFNRDVLSRIHSCRFLSGPMTVIEIRRALGLEVL